MQQIARAAFVAVFLGSCASAFAQSITPASFVVFTGGSTNITVSGPAGQQFGLIGSTTNGGFSYAGVNLQVGPDVQVLTIGTLDGAGQAVVPVIPGAIPTVTPIIGSPTIMGLQTTGNTTTVTFSADVDVLLHNQSDPRLTRAAAGEKIGNKPWHSHACSERH